MSGVAAVVGAGGIGSVHAREYARAGIGRIAIVGRTAESARARAAALGESLATKVEALPSLRHLAESDIVDVSLCTPTAEHFGQLVELASAGKRILCEKPLFWAADLSRDDLDARLATFDAVSPPGRIRLNTPNSYFLEAAVQRFGLSRRPTRFRFEFFTQGRSRGADIGVDLLPHALSLLRLLDPDAGLSVDAVAHDLNSFRCRLRYGAIDAEFDFREAEGGEKRLAFELDGVRVERVPFAGDGVYRVALRVDGGEPVEIEDPFAVAIRTFLAGDTSAQILDLAGAARLTRQMGTILLT